MEIKGTLARSTRKISLMIDLAAPYGLHRAQEAAREISPNAVIAKQRTKRKRKDPMNKNFEHMLTMNTPNVDATSFEGVTKATQAITTEIADYSKRSFEQGAKTIENLLGSKSLDQAFKVQSEYARAAYESYVSEVTKLGELYSDLAREAFRPYQSFVARLTPIK